MTTVESRLSAELRAARARLGLTQEATAERLKLGHEYYGRLERGEQLPSVGVLARLRGHLGIDANLVLGGEGEPTVQPHSLAEVESGVPRGVASLVRRIAELSAGDRKLVATLTTALSARTARGGR